MNLDCTCDHGQLCQGFKTWVKDAFQARILPPSPIQADNSAECNAAGADLVHAKTRIETGDLVGVDDLVLDHSGSMSNERGSTGTVKSRLEWAKGAARSVTALSAVYNDEHGPTNQQRLGLVTFSTLADGSHVFDFDREVTQPDGSVATVPASAALVRLSKDPPSHPETTLDTDFNAAFADLEADGYTALELPVEQGAQALTLLLTTRNEDPDTANIGFGLRKPGSDQDDYGDLMSRESLVRDPDGNYYMFLRIPEPVEGTWNLEPWSPPGWALYYALLAEDEARLLIWYARWLPDDPFADAWTGRARWLVTQADRLKTGVCTAP